MSPTSSNCMKSVHHDHQPLNLANKKFRRIADYINIYSDTQQATHARNRFGQSISSIKSIGACIMHSHLLSVHSSTGSQQPCHVIGWLHTLARYHLICHVWEAMHDSPGIHLHACITSQDRSNSAMDIELRYRVSSFKKCAPEIRNLFWWWKPFQSVGVLTSWDYIHDFLFSMVAFPVIII